MAISEEITRLQTSRNTIRTKLVTLGLAESTDKLDDLADEIDSIVNNGAVDASVQEGETYTIPRGYHNGSGTVSGVAGGGNYELQTKTVTPTTSQQTVTADQGKYGLSAVTVNAIPSNYKDVSSTTATEPDVLATKVFVKADGATAAGTMPNNGAVSKTLDATAGNQSYTVPTGYHNGSGSVNIVLEQKTGAGGITPTKSTQTVTPTNGKVLSEVEVKPIPDAYQDVTGVTAAAANVASSKYFVTSNGTLTAGTLAENGAISGTINGLTTTSYTIPAGITSGGSVTLTNDIEQALAAI